MKTAIGQLVNMVYSGYEFFTLKLGRAACKLRGRGEKNLLNYLN